MTQNFFLLLLLFLACKGVSQDVHIRVNLIGYEASHPKKALILSKMPINDAWFIFQENGKKVKEINPMLLKGENWAPFDYYYECNFRCLDNTSLTSTGNSWNIYTFSP